MRLVKCNLRGRKHEIRGQVCEDSINWSQNDETITVAVADGAGSSDYPYAKQGSEAISKAVCAFLNSKFDEFFNAANELELMQVIETVCKKALQSAAEENGKESIDEFASTLLCVSVKDNKAIAIQLGDGVLGKCSGGKAETITNPQNGEYASSTYFMTMPDAYRFVQIRRFFINDASHIFLMSDGVGENIYNSVTGEFYKGIYEMLDISGKPDGDKLLAECITNNIVAPDESSDDSTVAILSFKDRDPMPVEAIEPEMPKPAAVSYPEVPQMNYPIPPVTPPAPTHSPEDKAALKAKNEEIKKLRIISLALAVVSVFLAIALALTIFVIPKIGDKKSKDKDDNSVDYRTESTAEKKGIFGRVSADETEATTVSEVTESSTEAEADKEKTETKEATKADEGNSNNGEGEKKTKSTTARTTTTARSSGSRRETTTKQNNETSTTVVTVATSATATTDATATITTADTTTTRSTTRFPQVPTGSDGRYNGILRNTTKDQEQT